MTGYIKVYRERLEVIFAKDPTMVTVWMLLCMQVRFRETVTDGIPLLPGQVLTSCSAIANACNIDKNRAHYILRWLESAGMIHRENIRNRYSLITVIDPDEKSSKPSSSAQKSTAAPQPVGEQRKAYGIHGNVRLTADERQRLAQRTPLADIYIDNLSAYKKRNNKDYNDDFSVLYEWICKDELNEKRNDARQTADRLHREKEQSARQENAPTPAVLKQDLPDTPASYDLERAEYLARTTVPKVKKRKR